MQVDLYRRLIAAVAALAFSVPLCSQQTSGTFRWVDFHDARDQSIVTWVTRSLQVEKWTAIREIGVVYDAALVVTTDRPGPQTPPNGDTFTIWNVSLTSHVVAPVLTGFNPRWFDREHFMDNSPDELTLLYDNCVDCSASTYFTSLHYDVEHHMWAARWLRGGQGVLVWNAMGRTRSGIAWTQVYAVMSGGDGRAFLCTWNHFEYGKLRPPSNTLFRYDVDPKAGMERTYELDSDDAEEMELRMCRGQDIVRDLSRGQDSALCQQVLAAVPERKPVTTPPANNRGRSAPPAVRH